MVPLSTLRQDSAVLQMPIFLLRSFQYGPDPTVWLRWHRGPGLTAANAILGDGPVVTWGSLDSGGDSTWAQDRLKDAQQIQASSWAFAAIVGDGSVAATVWRPFERVFRSSRQWQANMILCQVLVPTS